MTVDTLIQYKLLNIALGWLEGLVQNWFSFSFSLTLLLQQRAINNSKHSFI